MSRLVFIKLGGSLITDKTKPLTARREAIKNLAKEIAEVKATYPDLALVIGTGAGSFGHFTVKKNALDVSGPLAGNEAKVDEVHASVQRLNRIMTKALAREGLKTQSFSADELLNQTLSVAPFLKQNLIPLVYGDIIKRDDQYRVISTEEIFVHLIDQLKTLFKEVGVMLVTSVEGVLDERGGVITEIGPTTQVNWDSLEGYDVTGGMEQKLRMARQMAKIAKNVRIIGGRQPGNIIKAVENKNVGTAVI